MSDPAPLTLGTAGHIDHGKTALITALTGKHTDRLPEEHERGISIELGYAPLDLPGGRRLSVVDVPGHERFVRTMVAGATGVDMFLLCLAADDGVMPQTREHATVLRSLGVDRGVVAVTKADLADPSRAIVEAAELLPGVEAVPVSAREGAGLDDLLAALSRVAARVPSRAALDGPARLHVDRSFTLKGIGTVVTGTLWEGELRAGDEVRLLPSGRAARVRSVQVHDQPVEAAAAGQRVALNLAGIARDEVGRGDVVCHAAAELEATYLLDAELTLAPGVRPLARGARVHVHHGTREAPARVAPLEGDELAGGAPSLAQLRLEEPLVPAPGDRLVIRQLAPPDTLGGGTVVDPRPRKHGGGAEVVDRLRALARGETLPEPEAAPAAMPPQPAEHTDPALEQAAERLAAELSADGPAPRTDNQLAEALGLEPRLAARALALLERRDRVVRVDRNQHFDATVLAGLRERIVAMCEREGRATIAGVRDELGTSRRYAQALLEHLDEQRVTRRDGDAHVLRRRVAR